MDLLVRLKVSHRARDLFSIALFFLIAICIFGYQFLFLYLPIWDEKVPIHWSGHPMADGWQVASDAFVMQLTYSAMFCLIPLIIGAVLNKFFIFGTRKFRYTPLSFCIILAFTGLFFSAGISESCYASYLAKGIMSNTGLGVFYSVLVSVFFMIFMASVLTISLIAKQEG